MSKASGPADPRKEIFAVLGVPVVDESANEDAATMLDGAWVGAFAHSYFGPLVVTGYEVDLTEDGGKFRDRNGEGTLVMIAYDGRHVVFSKRYPSGATFRYRGEIVGDTLAGFWESEGRIRTRGLFALRRSEKVKAEDRERLLRGQVRDRRALFFFAIPMLVPVGVLFAYHEAIGGLAYALFFTVIAVAIAVMGHQVLPHNRLLARMRASYPRRLRKKHHLAAARASQPDLARPSETEV